MRTISVLVVALVMSISATVAGVCLPPAPNCVTVPEHDEIEPVHDEIDEEFILRVITAEGGADQLVCNGVVQCLYNACQRDEWAHSVEEILVEYQYTGPADWISDEARNAWDAVFCSGYRFVDFEGALYFYAPAYCESEWHESQRFICEVGGVRFFEEVSP